MTDITTEVTETPTVQDPIWGELEQIQALDLDGLSFAGTNLRVRAGERTTFPIDDRVGFIRVPANGMRLTRYSISDQSGKMVIRGEIVVMGERIGMLGENDEEALLPVYSHPAFAVWRTYGHALRFEFQNPSPLAVAALMDLTTKAEFVPYVPRVTDDREPYERAAGVEQKYDHVSVNGTNASKRFDKGIPLDSIVLIPDVRIAANLTEYVNVDGDTVQRASFTSLIDSMVPLMKAAIAAGAGTDTKEKQSATNRLSTLTGYNVETDWPNRPSLGYVTVVGGEEITVFPDRTEGSGTDSVDITTDDVKALSANDEGKVKVSEVPFDQK